MQILKLLDSLEFVNGYEILDFKTFENGWYLKINIMIENGTILCMKEYFDEVERNYSYHWQKENGDIIIRWDNAPHHKSIETFPHHKHIGEEILKSYEISLEEILTIVEKELKK